MAGANKVYFRYYRLCGGFTALKQHSHRGKKKKVMCAVLNNSLYTQKTWGANGGKVCVQLITEFGFNCTWKKLGIPYSLYAIIMHAISKKPGIFITHSTTWNPQHRQAKSLSFISTYCKESWIQGIWC